jgi:hypothetical protein
MCAEHPMKVVSCCVSTIHLVLTVIKDLDILCLRNTCGYGMHQVFAECPTFSLVPSSFGYHL